MITTSKTSITFKAHIDELRQRAELGDQLAIRSLACIALVIEGWRYGDADPPDPPPDGGGEPIDLAAYRLRLAA